MNFITFGPLTLTTRDTAALIWLGIGLVALLSSAGMRRTIGGVVRALVRFLVPLALYAGWLTLVILIAWRVGAWEPALLKDTLVWFAVSGAVLFFRFPGAATEQHFFRNRALGTIRVSVLLEVYLNLVTFDLWVEIVLFPLLILIGLMVVVGNMNESTKRVATFFNVVLTLIVLGLVVAVAMRLMEDWQGRDLFAETRSFLLPLWLTAGALPFIAWFSLYATYQTAFVHMRDRSGRGAPWRTKLALLSSFHVDNRELHRFAGFWPRRLAEAGGFRAGRRVIDQFRQELAERDTSDRQRADDLRRFAGVPGTDEEGRQLDRREFAETISALEWVATCQSGWYQNRSGGRYPKDLVEKLGDVFGRGLPPDHGIKVKVRKNGQAWFAWRRTITGWCFAIGGLGPPPNQWFYDGPEPPAGYPGSSDGWAERPFERGPNWDDTPMPDGLKFDE